MEATATDNKLSQRIEKQKTRIKRAHIALMKHVETALYGGVMLMGTTEVVASPITAYTDGVNKRYGLDFIEPLTDAELRGLIMHENLHIALKQIPRGRDLWKKDAQIANISADLVVNDIITEIIKTGAKTSTGEPLLALPEGGWYDPDYHNWSHREVFNDLYEKREPDDPNNPVGDFPTGGDGGGEGNDPRDGGGKGKQPPKFKGKDYGSHGFDEHDTSGVEGIDGQELKDLDERVDRALREGGLLAGRLGAKIPRVISDLLTPKVDWREVLREFVSASIKGADEFTWRKLNRRQLANDIYVPSQENETIGEVIVAIDTSGSIGSAQLTEFATELKSVCEACCPDRVRILWWDTMVHGEQLFENKYDGIEKLLKPLGGGGTYVSSVSDYIVKERLNAECLIVFTDGYVESNIKWAVTMPTLWMITQHKGFTAPTGKIVMVEKEF